MRILIVALGGLAALAGLAGPLAAQAPAPAPPARAGTEAPAEDAMTDVDPAVLAQCRSDADTRKLKGAARTQFMRTCTQPED